LKAIVEIFIKKGFLLNDIKQRLKGLNIRNEHIKGNNIVETKLF